MTGKFQEKISKSLEAIVHAGSLLMFRKFQKFPEKFLCRTLRPAILINTYFNKLFFLGNFLKISENPETVTSKRYKKD